MTGNLVEKIWKSMDEAVARAGKSPKSRIARFEYHLESSQQIGTLMHKTYYGNKANVIIEGFANLRPFPNMEEWLKTWDSMSPRFDDGFEAVMPGCVRISTYPGNGTVTEAVVFGRLMQPLFKGSLDFSAPQTYETYLGGIAEML